MKRFEKLRDCIKQSPSAFMACAVLLGFSAAFYPFNRSYSVIFFCGFAIVLVLSLVINAREITYLGGMLNALRSRLKPDEADALEAFPLPAVVCDDTGTILWFSRFFADTVIGGRELNGKNVTQFFGGLSFEEAVCSRCFITDCFGRRYTVYADRPVCNGKQLYTLYFSDDTELKNIADEYTATRPFVMLISLDNAEDWYRRYTGSDYQELLNGVQRILEQWLGGMNVFFRKLTDGKYLVIGEERCYCELEKGRFSVLDTVRQYEYDGAVVGASLSIGVGRGVSVAQSEMLAKEAADMAQGRGGDQTAINTHGEYVFFGGISKGVEKHSKVEARVVAESIAKLMRRSGQIIIMGHKYSDFDSIGSACGLAALALALNKEAHIVANRETTLASALIERVSQRSPNLFIEPPEALKLLNEDTLVIVTDTQRADFCECPELLGRGLPVVVIDHHRRTVDCIQGAGVFYHEPTSSSASEMVTELLTYSKSITAPDKLVSEALLAGIVLDTKDFVLRAGVRTFEAAARLREYGADTVSVRRLFASNRESGEIKNEILAQARVYGRFAIAATENTGVGVRLAGAKAADELLDTEGVVASFVCFSTGNITNISARSFGDYNVQLTMEALGGGGHSTMAAVQLKNVTVAQAKDMLLDVLQGENK